MKIGQVVFNEWHSIRRYGIVMSLREKDEGLTVPWTYAKVKWFGDEAYCGVIESTNKLRNNGTDTGLHEYRIDKLVQISLEKELKILSDIEDVLASLETAEGENIGIHFSTGQAVDLLEEGIIDL